MLSRVVVSLTLFSSAPLLLPAVYAASPTYELINEEQGVTVYRSEEHEHGRLFAFKGVTTYNAPLEKVLYVLMDNEHRPEWVDRLYLARELDRVDAHDYVLYQAFELPAIMSDRDYVYRGRATIEPDTGVAHELDPGGLAREHPQRHPRAARGVVHRDVSAAGGG